MPNNIAGLYKEKRKFKSDTEKEADMIYMKIMPYHANRGGGFHKLGAEDVGTQRYKDYNQILKQVREVRKQKFNK